MKTLFVLLDRPAVKIMLEYKLADLWIGLFWKVLPIYDVSTPEAYNDFCQKRFELVPIHYYRLECWLCILPCLPVHFIFVMPAYARNIFTGG
jgi:hypothetical protein